jgi:hypothetical protein
MPGIEVYDTYVMIDGLRLEKRDLTRARKPEEEVVAEAVSSVTDKEPTTDEYKKLEHVAGILEQIGKKHKTAILAGIANSEKAAEQLADNYEVPARAVMGMASFIHQQFQSRFQRKISFISLVISCFALLVSAVSLLVEISGG